MRNFVKTWFRIGTKMMQNFVQKRHFVLFCGDPMKERTRLYFYLVSTH